MAKSEMMFDRYEVAERLGTGNFGDVYRCRDHDLGRKVIVKVFNPTCTVGDYPPEVWRARFLAEARAMARVDHPYIAPVLGFGRTETGDPYFVSPWYPDTLKDRLGTDKYRPDDVSAMKRRRRPKKLPLVECIRLTKQMLTAIEAIHRAGVIHRDLKPSNVLLSAKADPLAPEKSVGLGDVRIADLGLCLHPDLRLTRERGWLGTEACMIPEQRRSTAKADHRTDIYAAGIMFHRIYTGALPKARRALPDDAPEGLADWLASMGANDPDDRPETAAEAELDLIAALKT